MTRVELLAALERERICGDPAVLMQERYAPRVQERVAGHYPGPPPPPITPEQAQMNRLVLFQLPYGYDEGDPEVAADDYTPTREAS